MYKSIFFKSGNYIYLVTFFLFLLFVRIGQAQTTYTESAAAYGLDLGQNKDGGHAWSDFNGDGLLDVLVLENNNNTSVKSFLMRQGPAGTFTNVQATLAPGMLGDYAERQAVWGDLNGDGRPDFMINSSGNSNTRKAIQIFIQNTDGTFGDGAGGFAPITVGRTNANIVISDVNSEGAGFFDFEGDGDLDIFFDNHDSGIELLRNNYIDHTTHTVVNPAAASLFTHITPGDGSGVTEFGLNQFATDGDYGSAADVNDDGWVDIFMRKRNENDFFLNQGGTFTNGADLAQAANANKGANGLWDLDNDGDLDAVWTENGLTQIFRNDGPGVWTALGAATFPGLPQPTNVNNGSSSNDIDGLTAGDVDNDGDIDILFVGDSRSYLFINQLNSPTPAPGVIGSGAAMSFSLDSETFNSNNGEGATMVDIDDDGDLDIYINISNSSGNELYINNLPAANRDNHLLIDVSEDRGANGNTGGLPARVAIGTNVLIKDCAGNIISGLRQVNGVYGHGTQSPEEVHFGLPLGEDETYIIEVRYPNFYDSSDPSGYSRLIATVVAQPSTISGTHHYDLSTTDAEIVENENAPEAEDDTVVVPQGNTVSVQISLFGNDTEPDGEDFFIESVTQPAVGSVVIDDADAGLVTYTYNETAYFTGTNFDYTITDSTVSLCPALGKSDTATVYIEEPCRDPSGIDTDGDGVNDVCDLDNDNDGILDSVECSQSNGTVNNHDFGQWIFNSPGWTGSGNQWNVNANRAWFPQWNGTGTASFYQTINVTAGTVNTITFDLGADNSYGREVTLNVLIDGVQQFTETSNQIVSTNGGSSQNGNETLNMSTRSFSFTPSSSTVELRFNGVSTQTNHDRMYVDNVELDTGCGDLDGDGTPDIYDLDSDGDGCFDAIEGTSGLDFSDLNGDGSISGSVDENGVPTAVSSGQGKGSSADYTVTSDLCDDDGDGVNNANDKCPYFDDTIDSDNDGIPDGCDVDDDNDGISDCEESTESVSNEFAWTLNSPAGNLNMDTNYTPEINDWILDSTGTMMLNTSIFNVNGSNVEIEPLPASDKEEALANGDYIEVSFTTGSEVSSFELRQIRSGWFQPNRGDSYYTATAYTRVGSNAWNTLSTDVLHTDNGSTYASFQHMSSGSVYLEANTEYAFRFFVYGQIDDSSENYSIFDDVAFVFTACRSGNLDGDANPNHLDDDSDGDGCNDTDEAYADTTADADNNGMYGSGTPTVNNDGSVVGASYATPADGDLDGNYDFLQVAGAPTITQQPIDANACPDGSTSFNVTANGDNYQWQQLIGSTWTDISDAGIYSGTDSDTLTITNPSLSDDNNRYRVLVYNAAYVCDYTTSDEVELRVRVPLADAGSDQTICDGETATLTATASGGSGSGYTYLWSTGETTATINVTPSGNTSGNVIVDYTVTVTDGNGCTDSDEVSVTVEPTPTITVTSAPSCNFALFQPTTYTFEVTLSGGTLTATEGTVTNLSGNVWEVADVPDGTDVIVTATQGNCSRDLPVSAPNCVCPVVDPATSDGDEEFCQGDTVPEISASTSGGTVTIDWYDASSGGNLLQSNSLTYQPSSAGTYYAEARSTSTGCVSSSRTAVSVVENLPPNVNAGSNQNICDGESATLTATGSGGSGSGYTYLWSTGETTQSITVTPAGDPNVNTTYTYSVTITDSNGCENVDSVNVRVYSNPTATITTTDTTCGLNNGEITFTFPDHPNRTGIAFSIDNQANYTNVSDNSGSYDFTNLSAGTYDLWVRWGNSACPVNLGSYQINTIPVVNFNTQPTNQTVFAGDNGVFTATVDNADTYQWQVSEDGVTYTDIINGVEYSGAQSTTLTVINVGKEKDGFSYRLQASNSTTSCTSIFSNAALLTVNVKTVITNRRITHRVRKN